MMKKKMLQHAGAEGFTLIEMLVYVSIAGIILGAISALYFGINTATVKSQAILETEQQGVQMLQTISQTIRNANQINAPLAGVNSNSLSLTTASASTSPTIFSVSGGNLYIQEGTSTAQVLNSNRVVVSNVQFQNLTRSSTFGAIRISFTVSSLNSGNRVSQSFSRNFYSTQTLRYANP